MFVFLTPWRKQAQRTAARCHRTSRPQASQIQPKIETLEDRMMLSQMPIRVVPRSLDDLPAIGEVWRMTQHGQCTVNALMHRTPEGAIRGPGYHEPPFRICAEHSPEIPRADHYRFLDAVYQDLLSRSTDPTGREVWADQLTLGFTHPALAQLITSSPEYTTAVVQGLYRQLLRRDADPQGLRAFTSALEGGLTLTDSTSVLIRETNPVEQVMARILASEEYYQGQAGGTPEGFVRALYRDVLHRDIDPVGRTDRLAELERGVSREGLVDGLLHSEEYHRNLVQGYYQKYLNREADAAGLDAFVAALCTGRRAEDIRAVIIGSEEYLTNALSRAV